MYALDIDDCAPNPCMNGGACTDGIDSSNCTCVAGFNGTNCETSELYVVFTVLVSCLNSLRNRFQMYRRMTIVQKFGRY